RNVYGKGHAYYFGTVCDDKFTREFIKCVVKEKGIKPLIPEEREGIETVRRGKYLFILNHSQRNKMISLVRAYEDKLTHKKLKGKVKLEPKGVMILEQTQ
ncbi:MAG: Beta-galactosidase C-terminal domain, partial [Candidatus Omnitrophica bacterium]|nr:Beta-galactosidase C-terminal domain [Candidatus Omnitrophota bacterium]